MLLPISRKEARASNLKRYFTGKACKHGHVNERRVRDGACCECQRIAYRSYCAENLDKERERKRIERREWRESLTPEERQNYHRVIYEKYKPAFRARARARHGYCKQATPPWVDMDQLIQIYAGCPEGHHVDHIIPLRGVMPDGAKVCGLHVPWNLQYLPAQENLKKGNRVQRHELNALM